MFQLHAKMQLIHYSFDDHSSRYYSTPLTIWSTNVTVLHWSSQNMLYLTNCGESSNFIRVCVFQYVSNDNLDITRENQLSNSFWSLLKSCKNALITLLFWAIHMFSYYSIVLSPRHVLHNIVIILKIKILTSICYISYWHVSTWL